MSPGESKEVGFARVCFRSHRKKRPPLFGLCDLEGKHALVVVLRETSAHLVLCRVSITNDAFYQQQLPRLFQEHCASLEELDTPWTSEHQQFTVLKRFAWSGRSDDAEEVDDDRLYFGIGMDEDGCFTLSTSNDLERK